MNKSYRKMITSQKFKVCKIQVKNRIAVNLFCNHKIRKFISLFLSLQIILLSTREEIQLNPIKSKYSKYKFFDSTKIHSNSIRVSRIASR